VVLSVEKGEAFVQPCVQDSGYVSDFRCRSQVTSSFAIVAWSGDAAQELGRVQTVPLPRPSPAVGHPVPRVRGGTKIVAAAEKTREVEPSAAEVSSRSRCYWLASALSCVLVVAGANVTWVRWFDNEVCRSLEKDEWECIKADVAVAKFLDSLCDADYSSIPDSIERLVADNEENHLVKLDDFFNLGSHLRGPDNETRRAAFECGLRDILWRRISEEVSHTDGMRAELRQGGRTMTSCRIQSLSSNELAALIRTPRASIPAHKNAVTGEQISKLAPYLLERFLKWCGGESSLTPEQIAGITASQISEIEDVALLVPSLALFAPHQVHAFFEQRSHDALLSAAPKLHAAQLRALKPEVFLVIAGNLSEEQIKSLDLVQILDAHVTAPSPEGDGVPLVFRRLDASKFSDAQIGSLPVREVLEYLLERSDVSWSQIRGGVTPAQIQVFGGPAMSKLLARFANEEPLRPEQVENVSAEAIRCLDARELSILVGMDVDLSLTQVEAVRPSEIGKLVSKILEKLLSSRKLSPGQLQEVGPAQLRALKPEVFLVIAGNLSEEQIKSLDLVQILDAHVTAPSPEGDGVPLVFRRLDASKFSDAQIGSLPVREVLEYLLERPDVSWSQIRGGVTPAQIQLLGGPAMSKLLTRFANEEPLRREQVENVSAEAIRCLDARELSILVGMDVDLSLTQVEAVLPDQIQELEVSSLSRLLSIASFTEAQVKSVRPSEIGKLQSRTVGALLSMAKFTEEQANAVLPEQIGELAGSELRRLIASARLTEAQVRAVWSRESPNGPFSEYDKGGTLKLVDESYEDWITDVVEPARNKDRSLTSVVLFVPASFFEKSQSVEVRLPIRTEAATVTEFQFSVTSFFEEPSNTCTAIVPVQESPRVLLEAPKRYEPPRVVLKRPGLYHVTFKGFQEWDPSGPLRSDVWHMSVIDIWLGQPKLTSFMCAFASCPALRRVGVADTGAARNMSSMFKFSHHVELTNSETWDTGNVEKMSSMFSGARSANPKTSWWNTSNVTDFSHMFEGAFEADPDTTNWDTSKVENMNFMFEDARKANPKTSRWNTSKVQSMHSMFHKTPVANPDTRLWDTSSVTNFSQMFRDASEADPDTTNWDTSKVEDMEKMFENARKANPNTSRWNTSNVQHMGYMFRKTRVANPDTRLWDTSSVTDFSHMFDDASEADPDTTNWDTSKVENMKCMFEDARKANPKTTWWNTSKVRSMNAMFIGASVANPDTRFWDTSSVTDFSHMFRDASEADPDTTNWDTSQVTNMHMMFHKASLANPNTEKWNTSQVTDMSCMFSYARSANPTTTGWKTGNVTNMTMMFNSANVANPDTGLWDTSKVTDMHTMFGNAGLANPNTKKWNTSKVTDMSCMFQCARSANPTTTEWKTGNVTDMRAMFSSANVANPDTVSWDTSKVTDMRMMFDNASLANPNTEKWNTSQVTNMSCMFREARSANPTTTEWKTANVTDMSDMFSFAMVANPDTGSWNTSKVTNVCGMFRGAPMATPDCKGWDISKADEEGVRLMFGPERADEAEQLLEAKRRESREKSGEREGDEKPL